MPPMMINSFHPDTDFFKAEHIVGNRYRIIQVDGGYADPELITQWLAEQRPETIYFYAMVTT
jgi:hypothetical protein